MTENLDTAIPYTQETRDLCNLAARRCYDAVMSVAQLGDGPGPKFLIMQAAANQVLAMAAGGYAAYKDLELDHIALARGVLDLLEVSQQEMPVVIRPATRGEVP